MKRFLLFFLPLAIGLTACDTVDEDDRYLIVDQVKPERKVLLEEFTGQRCTNCPAAHAVIHRLEEQYGEDLVVVSIHAGNFGIPAPDGLMQEEGDVYAKHWGVSAYPCGIVDRQPPVLNSDGWASSIRDDMAKPTNVDIDLGAYVSEDGKTIEISTVLASSENVEGNLQLWITEDHIIGFQIDGSQRLTDYEHNNVFRACVNGTWGDAVRLTANVFAESKNSIAIDPSWDVNNLHVVAFVYNNSGVLQVEKTTIKINN